MRRAPILAAVLLPLLAVVPAPATPAHWPQVLGVDRTAPVAVAPGVVYRLERYTTAEGRQPVHLLEVDLRHSGLRARVLEACDRVVCPADEALTAMAGRAGALAGVNGDFFDNKAGTGRPRGGVMTSGRLLKSPPPGSEATLVVRRDGSMAIGPRTWRGALSGEGRRLPLAAVNDLDAARRGPVLLTPALGPARLSSPAALAVLRRAPGGAEYTVRRVDPGAAHLPQLGADELALLGREAATLPPGTEWRFGWRLEPEDDARELIGGGAVLVSHGQAYQDATGKLPVGRNPETVVGLNRDGTRAVVAVFDGRAGDGVARGVTPAQVAGYLLARGLDSALLLDGGGSSELVVRLPGRTAPEVLNRPSDGHERPVANGLFFVPAG